MKEGVIMIHLEEERKLYIKTMEFLSESTDDYLYLYDLICDKIYFTDKICKKYNLTPDEGGMLLKEWKKLFIPKIKNDLKMILIVYTRELLITIIWNIVFLIKKKI